MNKNWKLIIKAVVGAIIIASMFTLFNANLIYVGSRNSVAAGLFVSALCYYFPYHVTIFSKFPLGRGLKSEIVPESFVEIVGLLGVLAIGAAVLF